MDNKPLDSLPLESPLNKFCYNMDKKLATKNYFEYYDFVETLDPNYITNLLFADFRFRYNAQLNVLIEIYGGQGSGKSIFGINLGGQLGKIYEMPFNLEAHTLVDFDMLDGVLHNTPFRTTIVVDEQPISFYGIGSNRIMHSLKDYEEICRYTMKNIIYISPTAREHSSYYVFKEDQRPSVERFKNQECLDCLKQKECLKIYSENKFQTLCGIDFWKRHGYPVAFNFMLVMPRKTDNNLMPRGYVRLPVLPPELMKKYDRIKQRNINIFESKESIGWNQQRQELREFQKKYKDRIVLPNGKILSKSLIKAFLKDYFGGRSFTTGEIEEFAAIVKYEILNPDFAETAMKEIKEYQEL